MSLTSLERKNVYKIEKCIFLWDVLKSKEWVPPHWSILLVVCINKVKWLIIGRSHVRLGGHDPPSNFIIYTIHKNITYILWNWTSRWITQVVSIALEPTRRWDVLLIFKSFHGRISIPCNLFSFILNKCLDTFYDI